MDIDKTIATLHPLEQKVLPLIPKNKSFESLISASKLKDVEVMRALQWLENKKIIELKKTVKEIIALDVNGKRYSEEGLPERKFLESIKARPQKLDDIGKRAKLEKNELGISLGVLKKKAAIDVKPEKSGITISITDQGKRLLEKESLEELLLKRLANESLETSSLSDEEKFAFDNLKIRKSILKTDVKRIIETGLTKFGTSLIKAGLNFGDVIDTLTPEMLKDGSWKDKTFRRYDVTINVPRIERGKRHFVKQSTDYAKQVWIEMGFKEMSGPILNTSFWNFDALFTAQDHPVRELQDTFYIKNPAKGKLPDKKTVDRVRRTHENGGDVNSKGWQYEWDPEDAKKNVLRTHTTVLSAKTLASLKENDIPAKFFVVGKNFRNETLDWSHGFEFNQTDGIVVDPDANFRHLLGYLKRFFAKLGYPKARFRPAYFPYTEMSIEIDVFHPVHEQWVELGGAGIFRPEVVEPLLGKDIPVLAWGPGFDRIMMEFYRINDIRELYKNDIKRLREIKEWMR